MMYADIVKPRSLSATSFATSPTFDDPLLSVFFPCARSVFVYFVPHYISIILFVSLSRAAFFPLRR